MVATEDVKLHHFSAKLNRNERNKVVLEPLVQGNFHPGI